jgi:hypothetical protein
MDHSITLVTPAMHRARKLVKFASGVGSPP